MANIAILSYYSGTIERGVETFVYELSKRLSKKHKMTIFQAGTVIKNPLVRTYNIKAYVQKPKTAKNILSKFYLDIQSLKILLFTLKVIVKIFKGKYDIIIPVNGGWQSVIIRFISKLISAKVLISGHAGIGRDDAWNLLTRPDVFVALTTAEKKWAQKIAPEMRIEIIPNGVDLFAFNPQVKRQKISLQTPIVVCSSALDPYKRVDLTIRAVAKSKNLSLLLLGEGELAGQLDTLGKRLLGKRYLRLNIHYGQMASYYRAGQVFTLASKTEAFGISYLEAMACNLPIVTTGDSSREEIIGNAGILTNPQNLDQYAKDLLLAAKTNYRNLPYNQALNFSWNKVSQQYLNLINNLTIK